MRPARFLVVALVSLLPVAAALVPLPPHEVPLGGLPLGVGVDPVTQRVFVAVWSQDTVAVLDAVTLAVVAQLPVDDRPIGVAVDVVRGRVVVAHEAAPLTLLDARTLLPLARVEAGPGARPAVSPLTGDIAVPNQAAGTVTIVDGTTLQRRAVVPVGGAPRQVAFDATGRAFVARFDCGAGVPVIVNDAVSAVFPARGCVAAVGYDDANKRLVAVAYYRPVSILDGITGALVAEAMPGYWMFEVAMDPLGGRALITGSSHPNMFGLRGYVFAVDTLGGSLVDGWETGGYFAGGIGYHAALRRAFVSDVYTQALHALIV